MEALEHKMLSHISNEVGGGSGRLHITNEVEGGSERLHVAASSLQPLTAHRDFSDLPPYEDPFGGQYLGRLRPIHSTDNLDGSSLGSEEVDKQEKVDLGESTTAR